MEQFKMRSNLKLEPWGESIANSFIFIHLFVEKEKTKVWLRRRGWGGWFYPHSPSWKKNGFERDEEDVEDGGIPIPYCKERKKKFEREEEDIEDEEMGLG